MAEPVIDDQLVILLSGDDDALLADELARVTESLIGDRDRAEVLHELREDESAPNEVVDAASTPPFLADRRVVVARSVDTYDGAGLDALIAYVGDPVDTTRLVLEWCGGRPKKALVDAVKAAGGAVMGTAAPSGGKARRDWFADRLADSGLDLDRRAADAIVEHVGSDAGRLTSILSTLEAVYGPGARLEVGDVEPYLTEPGGLPPWELTDPIDNHDPAGAVAALRRMMGPGEAHPLQLMATLHRHLEQAMRLDGIDGLDDKGAAQVLGLKGSTFPARKALSRARALGSGGVADAYALLAQADLDLRGATGLESEAVMEVLVARLADPRRRRAARR